MPDDTAPSRLATNVQATGAGAAAVDVNRGIVQTGSGAQARLLAEAVALGSPPTVPAPPGGLLGLPKPSTRVFVGRDEQLEQLDRIVHAGASVLTQTVHGLGGVGKSEIALQYATRHQGRYAVVWWVVAEGPETIEAGLAELAFRLHPDVQVIATRPEAATWALSWLQSHDGWLLVLDNVEDRRLVEPLLGQLTRGHVLITTRRDVGWDEITHGCLRLDVLTRAAAVDLLIRLSGQADPAPARLLAEEVGCLPLALQQAGAYLRQTRISIERYLQRLRTRPAEVLARVASGDDARRAVARTWSVTIDAIAEQDPLAIRVLQILSYLAPDDLPRDVLYPLADPVDVDTALGCLASYNMITLSNDAVSVHRLVQAVTAAQLERPPTGAVSHTGAPLTDRDDILHAAIDLLLNAVPPDPQDDVAGWPRWTAMRPHIAAAVAGCSDEVGGSKLVWLLNATAAFDYVQGQFEQALPYMRRALAVAEASFGRGHPATAAILGNIGGFLRQLGRNNEAEPLQRQALAITEAELGPDHPDVAIGLNNLALNLRHMGRVAETEPLHRRAVAIAEAKLGPDHPSTARYLHNFGYSLQLLDRADEAEQMHRRALAINEAALGPDHPNVAVSLDNLALNLLRLDRVDEAEPLHRRALAISEAALSPEHPDLVTRMGNLALTLQRLGRADQAEPLLRRALVIAEGTLGRDHPTTAIVLRSLAYTLRTLGRGDEAEQLQVRAAAVEQAESVPGATPDRLVPPVAGTTHDPGASAPAP
jgi:tetratricopeptide (TPR) repeat protein